MKQFEIYAVSGGTFANKPRPAVIVQSLGFDEFDSITVIPITSEQLVSELRIRLEPSINNGLLTVSFAMIEKITTLKKSHLGEQIGVLDNCYIQQLEATLARFIGLYPPLS